MSVGFSNTNKPINPRGNDASPKGYNRAEIYSGKALDFDGVNDSIDISNFSLNGYTAFSVCFYKMSDFNNAMIFSSSDSISDGVNIYQVSPGYFRARLNGANIDTDIQVSLKKGFFVLTYDGTNLNWYYQAQNIGTGTTSQTFAIANTTSTIGRQSYAAAQYLNGQIAGFKAFNTALTAAQVADLYNNPEKIVPTGVSNDTLKLYLPMQEGAGTTAYDGSGNGNHGTINGATITHGIGAPVAQTAVIDWNKKENLIIRSEAIVENSVPGGWAQGSGDPLESSSEADPTGRNTASLINVEAQSNSEYFYNYQTPVTSGEEYTFSIWTKLGTANNAVFVLNNTVGWNTISGANYVATAANGYDEWKQVSITFTAPPSNKVNVHIGYHQETGVAAQDNGTFYLWGAALHKGSTPVLVPTFGTAQTSDVLLPAGLTTGRDITGVNLFENVRKQGALNLDGNSWAEVHDNASLDVTTEVSLEAWVNNKTGELSANNRYMPIFDKATASNGTNGFTLRLYSEYTASGGYFAVGGVFFPFNFTDGSYQHIVVTLEANSQKVYINGALQNSFTNAWTITQNGNPLLIGYAPSDGEQWLNASVAQPRIYNRALTAAEVLRNYNSGKNTYK